MKLDISFEIDETPISFSELKVGDSFCYKFLVNELKDSTLSLLFIWNTKLDKNFYFTSDGIKMEMMEKFREEKLFCKLETDHKVVLEIQPKPYDVVMGGK